MMRLDPSGDGGACPTARGRRVEARGESRHGREVVTASATVSAPYGAIEEILHVRPDELVALSYLGAKTAGDGGFDAVLTTRAWRQWLHLPAVISFRTIPRGEHAVIHLTWRARWWPQLLPTMEADLGLHPLSERATELSFTGEYVPPGGLIGEIVDWLVGGRVALSTAEAFVEDLAAAIERRL